MRTGLYWFPDGDLEELHNRTNDFLKQTASSVQCHKLAILREL